jgi:hypothetical protein
MLITISSVSEGHYERPKTGPKGRFRQILGHLERFGSGETITPIWPSKRSNDELCSSLMMLWQELESSASKICLLTMTWKPVKWCATGQKTRWQGHQGCTQWVPRVIWIRRSCC